MQDDIALNITTALQVKLKEIERPHSAETLTGNSEAYALYLQGRKLFHDRLELGGQGLGGAVASFSAATRIDPGFARAWSGLSASLWVYPAYNHSQDRAGYHPRAKQAVLTALRIDPDLPEARYVDLAITAIATPESRPAAENAIFEAVRSGEMEQLVAFELFLIMGSPALFEMNAGMSIGIPALRVFTVAWSSRGSAIRRDRRFHTWARDIGLVDFWNVNGWPDHCQPGSDGTFECG